MAALSILLFLLGAGVVAPEPPQHVVQESLDLQPPHIQQLLQEELVLRLPPDAVAAAATAAPSPAWPNTVPGFPPPWPEAAAITQRCRHRPLPPAAPALPPSSFGHLRRQAAALAALGPRIDSCCGRNGTLPCARRAWMEVLDAFCADEFGVKTRQFHCCRLRGAARRRCFVQGRAEAAADAAVAAAPPRDTVPFPPGQPTASNMGNICGLRGLRPGPSGPSGPIARFQLRLERDYGRCCRNGSLECAHDAWRSGLERLCREEAAVPARQQRCCRRGPGPAQTRCFAAAAPDPGYERELHNVSLARAGPALLRALCGPARLLSRRRPVPELLGAITSCCPRPPQEQRACTEEQLGQAITTLCSAQGGPWRDPQRCCSRGDPPAQRRCFDATYLARVTLGLAVPPPPPGHEE
ncbi:extracellular matrix protein 1 [Strigops habroptila]|uniref:Extracellular matrix protein 1 n=1 Tax=Strigops habroptila TaxID=2489341 RepID=A0A672UZ33_STRHB|nr:extracellular matrix protein 1 [Strigops habroptila]